MANIPKSKDPTEQALNAIEQALNVRDSDQKPSPEPAVAGDITADRADTAQPPLSAELFADERDAGGWTGEETPLRPANDDRETIGQILQSLRRRPSRTPYLIATAAAAVWIVGALAVAILYDDRVLALFATPRAGIAAALAIAAAIAVPVIFFYVLAHLVRRSQDLRLVAESMAEVAMRLAQPETVGSDAVVTVGQAVRREVAAMGDGIERALARAGELEALVHNEVSALERTYSDNEVRMRDLLAELASQRETLVAQAEQVRNAIAGVHLDLANDITSVGDLVAEKVGEVATRVTRSLTEKGEHIALALGHAGDSMIDLLSERGATLLDRLDSNSERTSSAITAASERLTDSLTFKTENIHHEFAEMAAGLQQMMTARLDTVAQGFAQNAANTVEDMTARSQALTAALNDTSAHMADTLIARGEEINATLRTTGDSLVHDLTLRGGDVVAKMEQTGTSVTETLLARSESLAGSFRDNAETLVAAIDTRGEAVSEMLTARLQAFEHMFQHGGTALSEKIARDAETLGSLITHSITEFDQTVKTYGGELVERLGARTNDVSESMHRYIDSFDERVTGRTSELSAALDKRIGEVAGTISARGQEVADAITAKTDEIDRTLGQRAQEVASNLDTRIGRFEELLVNRAESVTTGIEIRTKAAADALNARVIELSQAIKVNSTEAAQSLGELAQSTTDAIRTTAGEAGRSLSEASEQAARSLTGASEEAARSFTGKAAEIVEAVTRHTGEMTTVLSDKSGGVLATLDEKGHAFAGAISGATETAMRAIEEKGFAFTRSMLDNSNEISRMINLAGEAAANQVNHTMSALQDTAQQAIARSQETATTSVKEIMETHNMVRSDTTALFERLREANIMLQEVLSGAHENMSGLENTLMLRVSEFVTAMNDVTASTGEITGRVEANIAGFREVTARLVSDLGQLANQFEAHGQDLAQAIGLVDRSNSRTEEVVNVRRTQLDSLVSTLDSRTEDIEQRLGRFASLLDESLAAAATRAREVARVVSETSAAGTRAISEQYERVRENAEEVTRVVADSSVQSARAISEQYERVRENAEEVARMVAVSSAEGARALSDQYERVRASAEDERRRASEAMRAAYEQASGDAGTIFQEATERFADVMAGMKQMAVEMQRELEATRTELRRGIFDLPQETAESAAQMRRVIVDQIEALAELNRIIARHGRSLDAIEPMRRAAREESTLTVVSGRHEAPRSEPAPRPAPPREDTGSGFAPRPAPPREDTGNGFAPRPASPREDTGSGFAPPPRRPEPPPLEPNTGATRGWLTDVLNRASRESEEPPPRESLREALREPLRELPRGPDERTPRHTIESLDSLSVDIARMIDHEAATDLWDRYKRGERNVFTRRLYTLHGQKAFDEIRRKYRADREFRQTVDRYITEFERLLEEVSRDDREQMVARTYLTSETGKVYTMLAHAAGRFE